MMTDASESLTRIDQSVTARIIDLPEVVGCLFAPRQEQALPVPSVYSVSVDVEPGVSVGGRLYPSQPDSPIILYFHGNGELASDYDTTASRYTQMGISFLAMDYRGYGLSSGTPTGTTLLTDAVKCFNAVDRICRERNLIPPRRYVMGRSLGSAAAIEVALKAGEDKLAGLIIDSGFSDTIGLLNRLGLTLEGVYEDIDGFGNAQKIKRVHTPTLIIHGDKDSFIPLSNAHELYAKSGAVEKRLVMIPGAGHNDLLVCGTDSYFNSIRELVFNPE